MALHNIILHNKINEDGKTISQVVIPQKLLTRVLKSSHDESKHQSAERTYSILRTKCFWPYIAKEVEDYCAKCEHCLLWKHGPSVKASFGSIIAKRPLEILAMDFTMLEKGSHGFRNVIVLTDVYTKYTQAFISNIKTKWPRQWQIFL